jgi:hypothetical protein
MRVPSVPKPLKAALVGAAILAAQPAEAAPQQVVAWGFLKGTSQEFALRTNANHILYHGTRGPGKTDCQLVRFAQNVGSVTVRTGAA